MMLSARWVRSERADSLSLVARESPAPFSRKSVTSMAKSVSLSWLWLPKAGGAAVRSQRSGIGGHPPAVGATLADALRRGVAAAGGERANSLARSIIFGIESGRGGERRNLEGGGEGCGDLPTATGGEWNGERRQPASPTNKKKRREKSQRNAQYK